MLVCNSMPVVVVVVVAVIVVVVVVVVVGFGVWIVFLRQDSPYIV